MNHFTMSLFELLTFDVLKDMTKLERTLFFSALCIVTLIAMSVAISVFFILKYKKPGKRFLEKQDLNQRFLSLDYEKQMIYVLDSKRYSEAKNIKYSDYLFTYKKEAKKVDGFFLKSIQDSNSIGNYLLVDAFYSKDGKKKPHKNLLIATNSNSEKNTLNLISYTLPNITEHDWLRKKSKSGYMNYETYLLNFRSILSKAKQATFYLAEMTSIHGELYPSAFYRLMDKMCLEIKKNTYVVQVSENSFMFVDLNKTSNRDSRKFSSSFMDMCEGFIALNALKSEMILSIGMTTWNNKVKIPPLRKFVDGATENVINSYSASAKSYFEKLEKNEMVKAVRNELKTSVNRILRNKTWKISYTPFFPTKKSDSSEYVVDTYYMDVKIFGEVGINSEDFFYNISKYNRFDDAIEEILKEVNNRVDNNKKNPNIIVPIGELMFNKILDYFLDHVPNTFRLTLALVYTESTHINSSKFLDKINKAKEKGISIFVFFKRQEIPYIASDILSTLNGFMIYLDESFQESDLYQSRIKLYSMIEFLNSYDKPILIYGIHSLDEIQLACLKPVIGTTCTELENSSSWLEIPNKNKIEEFESYISTTPSDRYMNKLRNQK